MTENQWMSLVGLLAVLALVAWRMPGSRVIWGIVLAAVIVAGALFAGHLGFSTP